MNFKQLVRDVAGKHLDAATIQRALEALGPRAEQRVEQLDADRKIQLTGQFVRALRNVGVADSVRVEHDLVDALGAAPTSKRVVIIKDAISLIAIRNHVAQLCTAVGMPWSLGMQVQSAVSDVARFLSAHGGGQIETEAKAGDRITFEIRTNRGLGAVSLEAGSTPTWLVGVTGLSDGLDARADGAGTQIDFWIPLSQPRAA